MLWKAAESDVVERNLATACSLLAEYLTNMQQLYNVFSNNDTPLSLHAAVLDNVTDYFSKLHKDREGLSKQLLYFIKCTTASFRVLVTKYGEYSVRTSSLATIMNKVFFSIM